VSNTETHEYIRVIYNELKMCTRAYLPQKMVSNFSMNLFTKVFTYVISIKHVTKTPIIIVSRYNTIK